MEYLDNEWLAVHDRILRDGLTRPSQAAWLAARQQKLAEQIAAQHPRPQTPPHQSSALGTTDWTAPASHFFPPRPVSPPITIGDKLEEIAAWPVVDWSFLRTYPHIFTEAHVEGLKIRVAVCCDVKEQPENVKPGRRGWLVGCSAYDEMVASVLLPHVGSPSTGNTYYIPFSHLSNGPAVKSGEKVVVIADGPHPGFVGRSGVMKKQTPKNGLPRYWINDTGSNYKAWIDYGDPAFFTTACTLALYKD